MTAEAPLHISYDDVPYDSRPIAASHPETLFVHGLLAGLSPVDPREARVLEIGCAEGANLMPIAAAYEGARCVGVDAGELHIRAGTSLRDRVGLDNLELVHADVRAWEPEGEFDYILCHGVLSWVDDDVVARIVELARSALSPRGLAFLSYNVSAGWGLRSEMRRALLRRSKKSDDPSEALAHVRGLLSIFANHPIEQHPHAQLLAQEAQTALRHSDAYLAHEYLSPENRPFTFSEVATRLDANGLAVVGELTSVGNVTLLDQVREVVDGFAEDDPEGEDLVNLLYGRAFRMSLIARGDAERVEPGPPLARRLSFGARVAPESKHPSFEAGDAESFLSPEGVRISVEDPWLKAALAEMVRFVPGCVPFDALVKRATELLRLRRVIEEDAVATEEERDRLAEDLLELHRLQHVGARATKLIIERPSPRPRVTTFARMQARRLGWLTDAFHQPGRLDGSEVAILTLLDGSRDLEELREELDSRLRAAKIPLGDGEGGELEGARRADFLKQFVERTLARFANMGILES